MKIYKNKKYIIPFFIFNECLIIIMMLSLLLQSTYSVFLFIMIIFFNVVSSFFSEKYVPEIDPGNLSTSFSLYWPCLKMSNIYDSSLSIRF